MSESNILKRWFDPEFLRQTTPILMSAFGEKDVTGPADIRGIVVGLDGALPQLLQADFQDLRGSEIDASQSRISCAFSRARIIKTRFASSLFDTCRFKDAEFELTSFDQAKFDSPTLDDAKFRQCSFGGARITGRRMQEYGGRRAIFERCDFRQTVFRNLQLRSCSFRGCFFNDVSFERCLLVGTKFEGGRPSDESFVDCSGVI